jgi:L-histidine Nalpha-methyltransferase
MPDDRSPRVEPVPAIDDRLQAIWTRAYAARSRADLEALYADWASTYDADHAHVGFHGHRRAAEVLSRHLTLRSASVLDAGAGTGAAGQALADLGYRRITALDLSAPMLAEARAKGVYDRVHVGDLGEPLDLFFSDTFDAAILVGVFSFGQAPAHALEEIVRVARPGAPIVFTMRTDFFQRDTMGVRSKIEALAHEGAWRCLEVTPPEPYLPHRDPAAMYRVWCYEALPGKHARPGPDFLREAKAALSSTEPVKHIDHQHIWNRVGSRKYEAYIERPEYYLTECEEEILVSHGEELAADRRVIVELGCGSARKIKHVLRAAIEREPGLTYIPVDVSREAIEATTSAVNDEFGSLVDVEPLRGSFDATLADLPADAPKTVFFFGSSIGNLRTVARTVEFLRGLRQRMRPHDRLIIGTDLHKDPRVVEAAYNAGRANLSFFLNMVRRINDVLGARFDLDGWRLDSRYTPESGGDELIRPHVVDLRIAATRPQETFVPELGVRTRLEPGHAISVGKSRKFRREDIAPLAERAGLRLSRQWLDTRGWFSLNELQPVGGS